jgi:CRP/FNR family cyclic AMP-dependent transcriptional regulator
MVKKGEGVIKKGEKKFVNTLKKPVNVMIQGKRSFGERAADGLARYAGSWGFIIGFLVFLVVWMMINIYAWVETWDPYPFILLNLVLSCLAAIQAPVILMSQNRQAEKDRKKSEYDYQVNRKAEREIEAIMKQLNRIEKRMLSDK